MIRQEILDDLRLRWCKIQDYILSVGADGAVLSVDVNLHYATGRIYSGYLYMPAEGDPLFFVKRPNGLEGKNVFYIRKPEQIAEILESNNIAAPRKLLLEADELTYSEYIRLQAVFNPEETGNATAMMRNVRQVKTPLELDQFRISAAKHADTYSKIKDCYKQGMTDIEFQTAIENEMRKNGSLGLFRAFGANMDIFMGSVLAGDNAETPSPFDFALGGGGMDESCPLGANGTKLKEGTSVMVDMAGNYTPYITDMTRVFSIGDLPQIAYDAHQCALDIQTKVMDIAGPGTACAELYNIAFEMTKDRGFEKYFMGTKQQAKFVGHGIGLQINELPVLTPRSRENLLPGMVFALEPKYVIPGIGAVGIENSFIVTDDGLEKLTLFEENIIKL